jgi:hypothetical protein
MTTHESSTDQDKLTISHFTEAAMNAAQALMEALPYGSSNEWTLTLEERHAIDLLALRSRNAATTAFIVSCGMPNTAVDLAFLESNPNG